MIQPAFEILNQRGTPMFFSDVFANRPTAGIVGRIFISTDTAAIYRDTGTTWDLISDAGAGSSNLQQVTNNGAITTLAITTGGITATNLAGGGSQMVVVNNSGTFGVQAIPTDTNIYNSNGTLTGNRVVSYNSNYLSFTGGQTFFGSQATSTGLVVINNSSSDAHLQVVGANAPSIRIDNAGFGATRRFVMGLATATNNFIQGATAGDICISTASASPLLFGMWQSINASEVMRISTSNNLLIGTTTDLGYKLYVSGSLGTSGNATIGTLAGSGSRMVVADANGLLSTQAIPSGTISGSGITNYVPKFTGTSAIGNSNVFSDASGNLCIGSTNAGSTSAVLSLSIGVPGTTSGGIQLWAATNQTHYVQFGDGTTGGDPYRGYVGYTQTSDALLFGTSSSERGRFSNVGNLLIGTQTDSGYTLDVNGTGIFRGQLTASTTNGGTSAIFQNTNVQNSNGIELRGGTAGTALNWKIEKDNTLANALQITPSTAAGGTTYTTPLLSISSSNLVVNSSSIDLNPSSGSPNITLRSGGTFRGYIEGNASGGMSFGAGPSATIVQTITSGGNVLIGTTTDAGYRLDVAGTARINGNTLISTSSNANLQIRSNADAQYIFFTTTSVSDNWLIGTSGSNQSLQFRSNAYTIGTGSMRMELTNGGNLGLGVTPSAWSLGTAFDINGGPAILGYNNSMQLGNNCYYNGQWVYKASTYAQLFVLDNDGSFRFNLAGTGTGGNAITFNLGMKINNNGNISINSNTDTGNKLYLNGSLRIDGQRSSSASGASGQHLIINCDGTTYKIQLLNN